MHAHIDSVDVRVKLRKDQSYFTVQEMIELRCYDGMRIASLLMGSLSHSLAKLDSIHLAGDVNMTIRIFEQFRLRPHTSNAFLQPAPPRLHSELRLLYPTTQLIPSPRKEPCYNFV